MVRRQLTPGVFTPPENYVVGNYPWRVVTGDVDDDGRPDLVVTDPEGRAVWLLLQDPAATGRFFLPRKIADGILNYEATIADLNGDGSADIAIADDLKGANRLLLLYQDPDRKGTFLPAVDFPLPGNAFNIISNDLNGDGRADLYTWLYLARSGYTPNGVLGIILQKADGTLGTVTTLATYTGLNGALLATADYNSDNRSDLFAYFTPFSSDDTATISVLLQEDRPAVFSSPVDTLLRGIEGLNGATVTDLNNDGRPDIALVGFFPVGSPSTIRSRLNLFIQSGGGAFSLAASYDLPTPVSRVTAGDLDNDGRTDLILLGDENQSLVMSQSRTVAGSFNPAYPLH